MKSLLIPVLIISMFLVALPGFGEESGFVYDSKGKRDPFVPSRLAVKGKKLLAGEIKDLFLEGIVWDACGESLVIINDETLKTGDEILGFKIVGIEKKKVILAKEENEYSLSIEEEESKKRNRFPETK